MNILVEELLNGKATNSNKAVDIDEALLETMNFLDKDLHEDFKNDVLRDNLSGKYESVSHNTIMSILTESMVFKKHPNLLECERIFDDMLEYYNTTAFVDPAKIKSYFRQVEDILAKHFNFEYLFITNGGVSGFIASSPDNSGRTLTNAIKLLTNNQDIVMEKTNDRIRWRDNYSPMLTVYLPENYFSREGLTGKELMATVLQQIGVSFYRGSFIARLFTVVKSFVDTLILICSIFIEIFNRTWLDIGRYAFPLRWIAIILYNIGVFTSDISFFVASRTSSESQRMHNIFEKIFGKGAKDIINNIGVSIHLITSLIVLAENFKLAAYQGVTIKNASTWLTGDGLDEAKFSDDFAAMHGYGPDLSSAIAKFENIHLTHPDNPASGITTASYIAICFNTLSDFLTLITLSNSPMESSRAFSMAEFYRSELAKTKDPKARKFIEKQLVDTIKASSKYKASNERQRAAILQQEVRRISGKDKLLNNTKPSILISLQELLNNILPRIERVKATDYEEKLSSKNTY